VILQGVSRGRWATAPPRTTVIRWSAAAGGPVKRPAPGAATVVLRAREDDTRSGPSVAADSDYSYTE